MSDLNDYLYLKDFSFRIIHSIQGMQIPSDKPWQNDAQSLALKLYAHFESVLTISKGFDVGQNEYRSHYIDHSSMTVITRAAWETYLVYFHLFGNPDPEITKYRHKIWKLGGLLDRQNYYASEPEHQQVIAEEKIIIEELKKEIESSPEKKEYSNDLWKKIIRGEWKAGKNWSDLAEQANINRTFASNAYSYLCSYSHSSYLSALQIGQATTDKSAQIDMSTTILRVMCVIMSHFIFAYQKKFALARAEFESDSEGMEIAHRWHLTIESMNDLYQTTPSKA